MKHKTSKAMAVLALALVTAAGCTQRSGSKSTGDNQSDRIQASGPEGSEVRSAGAGHDDPEGYYTCSMHPQVHQHNPGTCPICGMKLIKVMAKGAVKQAGQLGSVVMADAAKLRLAGIAKTTVTRKDLAFSIPVSGRFLSSREVAFQVYESDLSLVKPGHEFSGTGMATGAELLKGRIRFVDTLLDPSSRTVRVVGAFTEPPRAALIDGAFHGEITGAARAQLAIPVDAVLHTGREDLVYLVTGDDQLKAVAIHVGAKARGEYQVLSGLKEGDVIAAGPNFLLDSEAKLKNESAGRP
jgi:hypothetical protein